MKNANNNQSRRSFLKVTSLTGGGMMIGFSWFANLIPNEAIAAATDKMDWVELTGFIKITPDNQVKIFNPNPEFGTNVMTSLPMMVNEELEADWSKVIVEMGDYDTPRFKSQFTGGSRAMAMAWKPLRTAGATARLLLMQAAANEWGVPISELTVSKGVVMHKASNKSANYGALATAAAKLPKPEKVELKKASEFTLLGTPQKNKVGKEIVGGESLFTLDYKMEGMLIAMVIHPPAFGMQLKSFDATEALKMPGIKAVFDFQVYKDGYVKAGFDTRAFNKLIAVVGNSTWEVMNARKKVVAQWEPIQDTKEMVMARGGKREEIIPAGLESTENHLRLMHEMQKKPTRVARKDGDPETAFKNATKVLERTYTAPFLAHNPMEPISCVAHITDEKAFFVAPIQIPEMMKQNIVSNLDIKPEQIEMKLARMGGGFGRRAYGHYIVEAGHISKRVKAPVKLIYTREDDLTNGIYRPTYIMTYKAAIDKDNNVTAIHVIGGGIPESPLHENRFPAGVFDNYLAESWDMPSNITIGAYRAPRSNFNASAEQSFLDELAETVGKDPLDFRIEMLKKAKANPVGKNNDYNADRFIAVLELLKEKSNWGSTASKNAKRGVSAYFCHASYAAHVVDVTMKNGQPYVEKVVTAMDCGFVVNPEGAKNMVEGAVVDGIGNALYGELILEKGATVQKNLNNYRIIRHREAPKKIDVHFVQNNIDPTGLGEPPFPPVFAAVANALYKATGKRLYNQPYLKELGKV
ncbi:MAG: isoquinoline 1-oxidoreductase [Sphingobacteriia bacterium 24-36-13]|jgi:isoquinoline 1-oxidoreductase beta subunit|uniref:xanthine dehydrogenase family protein molybdopterin-binding subunit n=1 Tax=Sediminibacterium sp. TaxID=1917865 RepID=UPI000BD6D3E5|nr:molybdopterin cofactor-binding domain-containing protein [Sediminibacterium sp.]OYZ53948.1 MAG: isoquinoline 1-oxidoreductase [Sphingobacteriia bacterium 24-36-13]OZA63594.1 MAG: isoquinoline 1-oxidoreductase [Sphingobacteriia bacterium 39-36-14]HQS24878.1 molybdopterin-dependent oxidoreductase [Sediminibacterium sp.]HQS35940.1 molybdopterin-dependent oxidoreductase [Sediminibacterium sp.]